MSYQDFPPALLTLSPRLTRVGDPSTSVVGINTTLLGDGCWCYCTENTGEYQLNRADNSTPPDGDLVLAPTAGPGRWFKRLPATSESGLPPVFFDAMTGVSGTTSSTFVPVLRQNGGAALGFDVPEQPAGSFLLITVNGSLAQGNGGGGGFGFIVPVVNSVQETLIIQTAIASNGPKPISGTYRIALGAGVTQVRFNWRVRTFDAFGLVCDPFDVDNPSWVSVSAIVGT